MIAPERDPVGIGSLESAVRAGFDYIELSLAHLAACSEASFRELVARVAGSGVHCETCNNFFPPHVRLTGRGADRGAALTYADLAMGRAARLGVQAIVLGSSGAKNVPDGFSLDEARGQLLRLLEGLGPLADGHGVTIVLEPISRPEANFVNLAAEALALAREAAHPRIQLLVDYYHLANESESPDIIAEAGAALRHVHFATPGQRGFPTEWEPGFDVFFGALGRARYAGRLSIEAYTSDFARDGARSLQVLRRELPRFGLT